MKAHYFLFGDLLMFDTTIQTSQYDMICAPFVCIDRHARNLMMECKFVRNEKIKSFV